MKLLNIVAVNFQCILTKIDKITVTALNEVTKDTMSQIDKYAAAYPNIIKSSSNKKIGVDKIHECLNLILNINNNT